MIIIKKGQYLSNAQAKIQTNKQNKNNERPNIYVPVITFGAVSSGKGMKSVSVLFGLWSFLLTFSSSLFSSC